MFELDDKRVIYLARHGSRAYGTQLPDSDTDIRGICVPPIEYVAGFSRHFEQAQVKVDRDADGNSVTDCVIFSLRKFMSIAAQCNPNALEILFVAESDILEITEEGEVLREARRSFLSKSAYRTFSGYAIAQLRRIKTHKSWLLDPPKTPPERKHFGLPENTKITPDMMGAFRKLENAGYAPAPNVQQLVDAEKRYHTAQQHWNSYQSWKKSRNPARAELEAKYGYDTKHAMHLVRLLRMCHEILTSGDVVVRRPDAEELLDIRRGFWTYDEIVGYAEKADADLKRIAETSKLPDEPNFDELNEICCELHEHAWRYNAVR